MRTGSGVVLQIASPTDDGRFIYEAEVAECPLPLTMVDASGDRRIAGRITSTARVTDAVMAFCEVKDWAVAAMADEEWFLEAGVEVADAPEGSTPPPEHLEDEYRLFPYVRLRGAAIGQDPAWDTTQFVWDQP